LRGRYRGAQHSRFRESIAPLVHLNAVILFVVGLALVRAHNRWSWTWPTVITVTGWMLLLGGLYRMIAPEAPQVKANAAMYMTFAVMVIVGLFLTFKAYGPEAAPTGKG
jgi:hypothetical protein